MTGPMPPLRLRIGTLLLAAAFASPVRADILIDQAWTRATPAGSQIAAAYLHIVNRGPGDDRILSVSSPAAADAMLHMSLEESGVSKMGHLDSATIPAGGEIAMKPGGMHVMLMGLSHKLAAGEHFPLVVTFEHAGEVETQVEVRPLVR